MKFKKYCVFLVLFCTFSVSAFTLPNYILTNQSLNQPINEYAYLAGNFQDFTPEVLSNNNADKVAAWIISDKNAQPYAVTGKNWFAFTLHHTSVKDNSYYLTIKNSVKAVEQKVYFRTDKQPYQLAKQSIFKANKHITQLPLQDSKSVDVLIYIDAVVAHNLPIKILSNDAFVNDIAITQFGYGIAIGGVVALALTLMFLYIANKNKMTLLLAGYFVSKALLLTVLLGINFYLLYPQHFQFKGFELPILTATTQVCLMWFVVSLFELKSVLPKWAQLIKGFCWLLLIYMPISIQLPLVVNLMFCMLINISTLLFLLALGIQLLKQKHRLAVLFIGVISLQLVFYFLDLVLGSLLSGSVGINIYGDNSVLYCISFWLNAFFITFLLSREHYFQVEEQQFSQGEALTNAIAAKQAQDELLDLQQNSQELLESKVQERTIELNIALQELESANRELEEINTRDELTGLYNRRFYDQKILAEYRRSKRNLTPLSLVIIDIDHFKSVNDTYGHIVGDQCIVAVATALKKCLRRSPDMACRYGGEEFCLILPETDTQGATALAEEIRTYINDTPVVYNEHTIELAISAGISTYKQQAQIGTDELFTAADKALYLAKQQGRNQVQQQSIEPVSST